MAPRFLAHHVAQLHPSLAAELGAALSRIHQVPTTGIPPTPAGWENEAWGTGSDKLTAAAPLLTPLLPAALRGPVEPYLRGEIPAPVRGQHHFVHNDICSDHVLVDPSGSRLCGIIDFADAMVDDPTNLAQHLTNVKRAYSRTPIRARAAGGGPTTE